MAFSFARFGNDLYTGKRSFDFVGKARYWFTLGIVLIIGSVLVLTLKGINPGIEFRGGSEFRIAGVSTTDQSIANDIVTRAFPAGETPRVSVVGSDGIRVQTERLTDDETNQLRDELATGYGVDPSAVTSSFVGASWGADVTEKALTGLITFLILVSLVIALYFRAWQMAAAAVVALLHDLMVTAGIYALTGFEVTPATVIGFLTILGYSLYDTVVVFDKVRENTAHVMASTRRTYGEAVNLAVNQTLVRSINTTVVALLPIGSILFIGAFLLGAGTLKDISLALLIGVFAGAYSSVFIAPALLVTLRRREPAIQQQEVRVAKARAAAARAAATDAEASGAEPASDDLVTAGAAPAGGQPTRQSTPTRPVRPAGPTGPRNQPKRSQRKRKR